MLLPGGELLDMVNKLVEEGQRWRAQKAQAQVTREVPSSSASDACEEKEVNQSQGREAASSTGQGTGSCASTRPHLNCDASSDGSYDSSAEI